MARGPERSRRGPKDAVRRVKKKPCALCRDKLDWVDYKDVNMLRKYMSDRGKIRARRVTGNCAQHQRAVALAIRTARELALVPYTQRTVTERGGGRGRRSERGRGREAPLAAQAEGAAEGAAEGELSPVDVEEMEGPDLQEEPEPEDEGQPAEVEAEEAV